MIIFYVLNTEKIYLFNICVSFGYSFRNVSAGILKILILLQFSKSLFYFNSQNFYFTSILKILILLQFSKSLFYFNSQNFYFTSILKILIFTSALKIFILLQFSKFLFYFIS